MKLLLTGVTGFIGKKVAEKLVRGGHEIHALVRKLPDDSFFTAGDIHYHVIAESSIKEIVSEVKPDVVIHIASMFLAEHHHGDIEDLINSNVTFPTQLLDAMSLVGVNNFINTGTSWQHYNSDSYNPVNLYAATKQAFEDIIKYYTEAKKIKCITLKIYDSYGPEDMRGKLISLLDRLAISQDVLAMSKRKQKLSFVHVDDISRAFEIAINNIYKALPGYNVAYGLPGSECVSLKELVSIYEECNKCKLNITWGDRQYREREVMLPAENLRILPDWKPVISLSEGLDRSKRS